MRTVHCSSHLPWGEVFAPRGEVFARGAGGVHLPPVDRILDTHLWKHYLSTTSFADGYNV